MHTQPMTNRNSFSQVAARATRIPSPAALLGESIELMGAVMPFARNAEIYGENEPAEYLYKVVGGAVRTYKVLNDGRRQIGAFYLPGDVFGLEIGSVHSFSAEAIAECKVMLIKRSTLVALAARSHDVANQLWTMTAKELQRAQGHIMLLIKTAQERVAGFLLEMASRAPAGNTVELPMSRQDIADYLGLTIETVSRTLTQLENSAAISVPSSRRIVLRNQAALTRLNA
ncbi:MAG: helix-turn-helix domain-containing protein [Pseudolabrys sp.]|nr:helix-turn-helix domain-containing protein [Pseudolabrys sp.]